MWFYTLIDVLLYMETVPVVHHPMFEVGVELLCVLLDVEMGLDTAGELQGVLQPLGLDTEVEPEAE